MKLFLYIIYEKRKSTSTLLFVFFQNSLSLPANLTCLGMWLWLLFKVFFVPKCIKMMFFLFFKNYFWDQCIKKIQNIQKINYFLTKQKIWIFKEHVNLIESHINLPKFSPWIWEPSSLQQKSITVEELPDSHDNVKRSMKIIKEQQF
jgi:hypothetical protein